MSILIAFIFLLNVSISTNIFIKYVSDDEAADQSKTCEFEIMFDGNIWSKTQYLNQFPSDQGQKYELGNSGDNVIVEYDPTLNNGENCADGDLLVSEYEHNGNRSKDVHCPYHHCGESQSSDSDDNFSCGDVEIL